jgi:tRNA-2-methylthio-N6-dimethylallyladenosine synthase
MEEVGYADLFSFAFSARPETDAARYRDALTRREKQERLDRLQSLQRAMTLEMSRGLVGTIQEVLVEGNSKRGDQLFGRTSGNRVVNFPGDRSLTGSMVRVTIREALPNSLLGEIA